LFAVVLLAVIGLSSLAGGREAAAGFRQAEVPESITVPLEPLNDSGVTGAVTVAAEDGTSVVTVQIFADEAQYPAHIHVGTCEPYEANPTFPLSDADPAEDTTTTVEIPYDKLVDNGWVVIVHIPSDDLNVLLDKSSAIACGELTTEAAERMIEQSKSQEGENGTGGEVKEGESGGNDNAGETPATGVGTTVSDAAHSTMLWLMSAFAVVLAVVATRLRQAPAYARQSTEKGRY
jgi:hypothetical protein